MRRRAVILVGVLLAVCCVASAVGGLAYRLWPRPVAKPVVLINSPGYGEQVNVGERVTVRAIARDEAKVALVELWVDGQLQESQRSALPGGISPFPLLAHWQPLSPGTHTLTARAFNAEGARGQAAVNVEAVELTDADADGVPDDEDLCPDEPGSEAANGCPDRDGDGVRDAEDACPDQAGLPEADGCPVASAEDRDGDGLLDWADACPGEPGSFVTEGCLDADGDGVADPDDLCPADPGLPEHDGCTVEGDLDGDGIPDPDDECPEYWGLPEHGGCPDVDGDGIRDLDDDFPERPGLPPDGSPYVDVGPGEPGDVTDVADSDGDGVSDPDDECPGRPGEPPSGCPPPDGRPEEGTADTLGFVNSFAAALYARYAQEVTYVEFQAYEFQVFDDYDQIYCYVSLAGAPTEQYGPFEPAGERYWNIPDDLGSVRLLVPVGGPLDVYVECEALVSYRDPGPGPGDGTGYFIPLGSYTASHDPSDWLGHEIEAQSRFGEGQFRALYRICAGSCEEAVFSPPILDYIVLADSDVRLHWSWDGDREAIEGFNVYRDDNWVGCVWPEFDWAHFPRPACGRSAEFEVTAFAPWGDCRNPSHESPRSNTVVHAEPPCPRTVPVTFNALRTYNMAYYNGPIRGEFFVNDAEDIVFDAAAGGGRGLRLESHSAYDIQDDIWEWILERRARCGMGARCPYTVSGPNSVAVRLGPDDNLTFGGTILDEDGHTLFEGEYTVEAGHIVPGQVTIRGWKMDLMVLIDMTINPETSGPPDLIISDVTQDAASGQLLIAAFNGWGPLESQDIAVRLERMTDDEIIGSHTWEDVTLAAGEMRVLHDPALVVEPRDLRVIIDPDNHIREADEANNTYETPLLLSVEFLAIRSGFGGCLESRLIDPVSEFVFHAYVAPSGAGRGLHGFSGMARIPESDYFYVHRGVDESELHGLGGELHTLEFEMPRDQNLYVGVSGVEVDPWGIDWPSDPDDAGQITVVYEPDALVADEPAPSYIQEGAYSDFPGWFASRGAGPCDDPNCEQRCGFHAQWRITRVR